MNAGLRIDVVPTIKAVPAAAYDDLVAHCAAPAYYDRRFLLAAETCPLIAVEAVHYIMIGRDDHLLGFLPVYRQHVAAADPLGLLARTSSAGFHPSESALFSHIMHCCDTRLLLRGGAQELYGAMIDELTALARNSGVPQLAIANVADRNLLDMARATGLEINHSVDRYRMDIDGIADADTLIERHIPRDGRSEIRRQRRKIAEHGIGVTIDAPPFDDLEEVGRLCHATTARRGTPDYLPAARLARFLAACGDLVRIISVRAAGRRVGVGILLVEDRTVHFWLAGMDYSIDTFSPYTATFEAVFRFAFDHGCSRIECGRLNERIKRRFGFTPQPLYSIVHRLPGAPDPGASNRHGRSRTHAPTFPTRHLVA